MAKPRKRYKKKPRLNDPRRCYTEQRHSAECRGIPFKLTYDKWLEIWLCSGQWYNRGAKNGGYVMARYGDTGAYEAANVRIISHEENLREGNALREYQPHSEETKAKIAQTMMGQTRPNVSAANRNRVWTEEMRNKISVNQRLAWAKRNGELT